ncbi:amidase 1-like isoform X2 [Rhododendron vialii]|uniref:amidase 1-like isoform X2 n=1 Tax=Rhododendron vialii TaxID=182163 RepID=UPI00265EF889|nr:amidase 1-like isoform X2 [Rhododendron vialii]
MAGESDYGAFTEKFIIQPSSSPDQELPLKGLTFAVKDILDMEGYVTGFGNPDWARTHSAATTTAPAVLAMLSGGATCMGRTVMDEMAYSINGENKHYGTPKNICSPDRLPGGSSSGSAVAVAGMLVDFSLGWFARDADILNRVGRVLLQLPEVEPVKPTHITIAEDCFPLLSIPSHRVTSVLVKSVEKLFGGHIVKYACLGDYVKDNVPTLKHFKGDRLENQEYNVAPLAALSSAYRRLERSEFKNNHGEWVNTIKPDLGPGISERVWAAVRSTDENLDVCHSVKTELHAALTALLGDHGILAIPTVPGLPPKLQTEPSTLETFRFRAFSLLSIAGMSSFCQVSIPLGTYDNLPVSVSLLAKHGSDGFLLNLVETLYGTLREQIDIAQELSY